MVARWRGKGRGDRNGWRLNECDSVSNAASEKETAQLQRKIGRRGGWRCREGGSGANEGGEREVNMERLSLQFLSMCPSAAGQWCVWLLYLDGL